MVLQFPLNPPDCSIQPAAGLVGNLTTQQGVSLQIICDPRLGQSLDLMGVESLSAVARNQALQTHVVQCPLPHQ